MLPLKIALHLPGSGDGTEGKEHTLGQTLLAESATSMLSLSNSIWADHAALQHQCRDREHTRSMEDQALREVPLLHRLNHDFHVMMQP